MFNVYVHIIYIYIYFTFDNLHMTSWKLYVSFDYKPNGIPFGLYNQKENSHFDHISFISKGIQNVSLKYQSIVCTGLFSVQNVNTEKSFWNIVNPNQSRIVITLFR